MNRRLLAAVGIAAVGIAGIAYGPALIVARFAARRYDRRVDGEGHAHVTRRELDAGRHGLVVSVR